ncbi:MAG: hypothetical protein P1S60_07115 [Anaerolineae bacterium]|nr:hypothetical protein [Anaerolineae bacterium]
MEKVDEILVKLETVIKDLTILTKSHEVLLVRNEEQHKAFTSKVEDLIEQKKIQNGRVSNVELATHANALAIAGMKSYTRAWGMIIPLVITGGGLIVAIVAL